MFSWLRSLVLDDAAAAGGGTPAAAAPVAAPVVSTVAAMVAAAREHLSDDGRALQVEEDPLAPAPPAIPPADAPAPDAPKPDEPIKAVDAPADAPAADAHTADAPVVTTVVLPGRQGQEPIEVDFPDQDSADRVRAALNGAMRGEEVQRQLEKLNVTRSELEYVEDLIRVDPTGFVMDKLKSDTRLELALTILAEEGALEKVRPILDKWTDNADSRRVDRLEAQNARLQERKAVEDSLTARQHQRAAVSAVIDTVDRMTTIVPTELQDQFADDLLRDMQEFNAAAERRGQRVGRLTPPQIVKIVERRLHVYGTTPEAALAAIKSPAMRGVPTAQPKGEVATRIAAQVAAARTTGDELRRTAAVRRTAASVPSPGAGGAPPAVALPKERMQDRLARVRALHAR